ncbi:hypothetical protein DBR12_09090 [Acidovorax sp. HMWF029]|uniref:DUF2971 domain-containing protein n=1 Tax=Acidovorax sp. HMWF029 TaxID=2056863 RepID=UPI000D3692EB|nr:DUF2971 domain-containing protein [Acidovorax sp. HMWF029]PTT20580.1 hypothetical protein DBR12_09090 [Acidovorax sp. HMWF029]
MDTKSELRRYTSLPALLRILRQRAITLLPPDTWDDQNDRELMGAYAKATKSKTCLALCFAQAAETYHHWKVFSPGNDGVCIVFNKDKLISKAEASSIRHGAVNYLTLKQIKDSQPKLIDLPFSKRTAYKDEKEYRFLFDSPTETHTAKDVPIAPEIIERILINPWAPDPLYRAIKETILAIAGFEGTKVFQSSVRNARDWRELAIKYA